MKNSFIGQWKHDFTVGIVFQWKKIVAFMMYIAIICFMYVQNIESNFQELVNGSRPSIGDFILHLFVGMDPVTGFEVKDVFKIPVVWFTIFLILFLLLVSFPKEDFSKCGYQYIIRENTKRCWWISKIAWLVTMVVIVFAAMLLVCSLFGICLGNGTLKITPEIAEYIENISSEAIPQISIYRMCMITPILIVIGLGTFQMMVSMMGTPILAYSSVLVVLAASAYYTSPYLIGNYLMVLRNEVVLDNGGIYTTVGNWIGIGLTFVSSIIGYGVFKKKDIM